jgi:hypothetical protein
MSAPSAAHRWVLVIVLAMIVIVVLAVIVFVVVVAVIGVVLVLALGFAHLCRRNVDGGNGQQLSSAPAQITARRVTAAVRRLHVEYHIWTVLDEFSKRSGIRCDCKAAVGASDRFTD